jgi:sulfite reductase beta subunit-like hemoprotein
MEIQTEIEAVAKAIEAVRSGNISPEEFRRVRVIQGIYPIRGGADQYLLRVRIPLGRPSPFHLRALADASDRFASGRPVHLTMRQDVHIYGVRMRDIPEALTFLSGRGLTTREACGDTVRNIVVCPFAGIARDERFDVAPYAEALGRHLLRNPVTQKLPRKFKIAFEGCDEDHVGLAWQDISVRAVLAGTGRPGFRVTLAGGLGSLPQAGIQLEPFTASSDLAATVEAVLHLFDRLGDRQRRGRARLKFVALSMGEVAFREAVLDERRAMEASGAGRRLRFPEPVVCSRGSAVLWRSPCAFLSPIFPRELCGYSRTCWRRPAQPPCLRHGRGSS